MSDTDDVIETLRLHPSVEDLDMLLRKLLDGEGRDHNDDLKVMSAILDHTIPETYELLPKRITQMIDSVLMCRVGLSHLIKRVETGQNQIFTSVLINIVGSLDLIPKLLSHLSTYKRPKLIFKELKGLLIHKILEVLNKTYLQTKEERLATITHSSTYFTVISDSVINSLEKVRELQSETYLVEFIIGILSTGDKSLLVKFFNDEYCNTQMTALFSSCDASVGKFILNYLKDNLNDTNIPAYATILKDVRLDYSSLLPHAVESNDPQLLKLTLFLCEKSDKKPSQFLKECVDKFGSKQYMSSASLSSQEDFTRCIMVLIEYIENDHLTTDPSFLKAISNRLESTAAKIRSLGMSVAETCYQKTNTGSKKFMFDIKEQIEERNMLLTQIGGPIIEELTKKEAIKQDKTFAKANELIEVPTKGKSYQAEKAAIGYIESDSEDSDDEDVSTSRKSRVSIPVYLNELLRYIQSESSDKLCYEKQSMAFKIAAQLIRHKAGSDELKFYGNALLENIVGLSNRFDFADFESWKLSVLIAITSGDFDNSTEKLLKLFISGDYSLSQRIMILSCLSLTCRELSGYMDDFVKGKDTISNVGSRLLPAGIHEQFIAYEAQDSKQIESVSEITKLVDNIAISDGTVVRKSANLIKKQNDIGRPTKDTKFFSKIGKLYFSLVSVWFTASQMNNANGFNVGQFSSILNGHFIKTLALLLECAIPLTYNYTDMINEYFVISIESLRDFLVKRDPLILEAVLIGLNVILDKVDHTLIGRLSLNDLISINECLVLICNEITLADENIYKRAVFVARQISDIIGNYT